MRIGSNPLRHQKLPQAPNRVAAVITHLPDERGYHSERLEVVQLSLRSLRANAGCEVPVLVWDNGSCPALTDWLVHDFRPETLILSPNVGKSSARASIFHMVPPDTLLGMADDDMLYHPGWWTAQEELLTAFANVGAVSGYPTRAMFRWGTRNTIAWARQHGEVEVGNFMPKEWHREYCLSVGLPQLTQEIINTDEVRITVDGQQAYAQAHHCQFLAVAGRIAPLTKWNDEGTSHERAFDESIDEAGYLRLTTPQRLTQHMGNVLDDDLRALAAEFGLLEGVHA